MYCCHLHVKSYTEGLLTAPDGRVLVYALDTTAMDGSPPPGVAVHKLVEDLEVLRYVPAMFARRVSKRVNGGSVVFCTLPRGRLSCDLAPPHSKPGQSAKLLRGSIVEGAGWV